MSLKDRTLVNEPILNIGIPTFMHSPLVSPKKGELQKMIPGVAIIGAPLEMAPSLGLPGASLGPRAIRLGSESLITYNAEFDIDINDYLQIVDCGDIHPVISDVVASHKKIQSALTEILDAGLLPIVLGGDHSIPIPTIRAFHDHLKGKIGIIHFDSHHDTWDSIGGIKYTNASPISRALELERVSGRNVVSIGVRGDVNDVTTRRRAEKAGMTTFYRHRVHEEGIAQITKEAIRIASDGTEGIYLTFDIDCLDAAHAPATSIPAAGGLSTIEAIVALRIVAKSGLVKSMDLVEVGNPAADANNITGRAAATLIVEFLAATALHMKG